MGIDVSAAKFLKSEIARGIAFSKVLTLGRQGAYMDSQTYSELLSSLGGVRKEALYADDLIFALGADSLQAMDVSGYEGAAILHDLNEPIARELHEAYDCVFDGGALEHVFNFPVALRNCMEMVRVGGQFISIAPANDFFGHGFYQFSPELFFSSLSAENGYCIERMLFVSHGEWFSVRAPAEVGCRVELLTDEPTLLFVSAKRVEKKLLFSKWPQQSDYVQNWTAGQENKESGASGVVKAALFNSLPFLRKVQERWRRLKLRRQFSPRNRHWFTPVDID